MTRDFRSAWFVVASTVLGATTSGSSAAEEAEASYAPAREQLPVGRPSQVEFRAVLVVCEPTNVSPLVRDDLKRALRAELGELKVEVHWASALPASDLNRAVSGAEALARGRKADAVAWFETTEEGWSIFLYEARGPQLRKRTILAHSSSSAVEEVTVVLRSALTAIVEGLEAGMREVELPTPPQEVTPQPLPPPALQVPNRPLLSAGFGYAGALYAADAAWHGGGFVILRWRPWRGAAYVAVSHTWFLPLRSANEVDGAELVTQILRRPVELSLGSDLSDGPLRWGVEGGLIADRIERVSVSVEAPFERAERLGRWQWAFGARVRGAWLWTSNVGISCSVGVDVLPGRLEHMAETSEGSVVYLRQMPVRPRAELGAILRLW